MSKNVFSAFAKLKTTVKISIIAGVFAVIFLGLAIGAAFASPVRARQAIEDIGQVTFTAESKEKIDNAILYYEGLGKNTLGESAHFGKTYLKAYRTEELDTTLTAAKREYVRLAIKNAVVADRRKFAENYSAAELTAIVKETRAVIDDYCKGCTDFEFYQEFTALEKEYTGGENQAPSAGGAAGEEPVEPDLCA